MIEKYYKITFLLLPGGLFCLCWYLWHLLFDSILIIHYTGSIISFSISDDTNYSLSDGLVIDGIRRDVWLSTCYDMTDTLLYIH